MFLLLLSLLSGFSFTDTGHSQDSRGRERRIFFITLYNFHPLTSKLFTWDDYHMFLIAALVFTRLLLDEIYHLNQSPTDLLMMWGWFFLFTRWFDSRILLQLFDTRNRWNRTCIDYHPCVTSEPTKLVCYSRQVRASYLFTQISWMNKFLPCGVMPSFWYVSPYFYEAI